MVSEGAVNWFKRIGLAFLFVVLGSAAIGALLFLSIQKVGNSGVRVEVPGQTAFVLPEAGTYTVFLEFLPGQGIPPEAAQMDLGLYAGAAKTPIALTQPSMNSSYTVGGRRGVSVLQFSAPEPGSYVLVAEYPDGVSGPPLNLMISQGPGMIVGTVLGGVAAIVLMWTGAIAYVVWPWLRSRWRGRREIPAV